MFWCNHVCHHLRFVQVGAANWCRCSSEGVHWFGMVPTDSHRKSGCGGTGRLAGRSCQLFGIGVIQVFGAIMSATISGSSRWVRQTGAGVTLAGCIRLGICKHPQHIDRDAPKAKCQKTRTVSFDGRLEDSEHMLKAWLIGGLFAT